METEARGFNQDTRALSLDMKGVKKAVGLASNACAAATGIMKAQIAAAKSLKLA